MEYLHIFLEWRKVIFVITISVAISAIIASIFLPNWYKSTVTLLPPKERISTNMPSSASSLLKGLSSMSKIGALGGNQDTYNYLAILKSRIAKEYVINRFSLKSVYAISDSSMEKTIEELEDNCKFVIEEEDYLTITVWDKNPQRAADIANYYVEILNRISLQLSTLEARKNREFLEGRVEQVRQDLRRVEEDLKKYQEKKGLLIISTENGPSMTAVGELYAMKVKKEIEQAIMERSVSEQNPELHKVKEELQEINKKIDLIPSSGVGALRLYREVIIQQKILEFIVPLFEQSKVDEQKDVPVILILDKAVAAERKTKPKRTLIVLITTLTCFITVLLGISSYEHLNASGLLTKIKKETKIFWSNS
jgi:tyrosine-protein kinase Etk/Wzc